MLRGGAPRVLGQRVTLDAMGGDGHRFPVEISLWQSSMSGVPRFNAFVRDITEMRRAEQQIAAARDAGDLKENGGYHAAKDEQGKIEARIRTLINLLKHATVGESTAADGIVGPGTVVTATIAGDSPPSYDVAADGRFVMIASGDSTDIPISVILNWTELLAEQERSSH